MAHPHPDRVLYVVDFWDIPRSGVAEYRGIPHWFVNPFDHALDDYSEVFHLYPIPADAALLARAPHDAWQVTYDARGTDPRLWLGEELSWLLASITAVAPRHVHALFIRGQDPSHFQHPPSVQWTEMRSTH